jgi:hypothetical protein
VPALPTWSAGAQLDLPGLRGQRTPTCSGVQHAPEVTELIRETCGISYLLHPDATWDLYRAFGAGHVLLAPRQAWAIVDSDGIVRWLWRMSAATGGHRVPLPSEVLAVARDRPAT